VGFMVKKTLCLALAMTLINISYAAEPTGTLSTTCEFKNEKSSEILCVGPAKLAQTIVAGAVNVAGSIDASETEMQIMQVAGDANLTSSRVKSNVMVSGNLNANHGQFEGDVSITAEKVVLKDSSVKGSITIKSPEKTPDDTNDKPKKPIATQKGSVLELQCGTEVAGSVTFIGKQPGLIKKSEDSVINGKITNGTVEVVANDKCDS
jgi:hypothetical protein